MNKLEIVAGLEFMDQSGFHDHPAFDLFTDNLADESLNFPPPDLMCAWHFFREGWECGASGAGHDD